MRDTTAQRWVQRWDAQQERYIPDREERFRVVIDVVRAVVGAEAACVVDLGCGPGSLSARIARALPRAKVVGVDADPLLLGLGAANVGPRVTLVEADLTHPGWPERTGLTGPWDAAVSSTALHWLEPDALAALYRTLAERLRPGGVFVNADHLGLGQPTVDAIADTVRLARAARVGTDANEDWAQWWQALGEDEELAPLLDGRSARAVAHSGENGLTVSQHADLLRSAGFAEAAPVWQFGDDHVLVAVR
ncbi:class I SAM-dependent methyltransferase [Actinophytocola gossypii]|uniref:Class I SAM-dependent methyltransferase n=1 Tax=Actinophytocola gossypii TaxID=2812003 RepID=A0ABT2J705_9PSEU|nr:class I SAM-dependent methyltransferase [Actinophytocola gossypii]MCT2583634.1 class I SAM-dependent methyltransferase [Actinophytocola gossypii]